MIIQTDQHIPMNDSDRQMLYNELKERRKGLGKKTL